MVQLAFTTDNLYGLIEVQRRFEQTIRHQLRDNVRDPHHHPQGTIRGPPLNRIHEFAPNGENLVGISVFMVLVGLSMPPLFAEVSAVAQSAAATISASQPMPSWGMIGLHVLVLTAIGNLGKMFPLVCYRQEAHWKERLALCIGLWPRGEVGAGVLILSLSYGIGGPLVTVAMLCLALNLILTGGFILIGKRLVGQDTACAVERNAQPQSAASQPSEG